MLQYKFEFSKMKLENCSKTKFGFICAKKFCKKRCASQNKYITNSVSKDFLNTIFNKLECTK